jgi:hypothetical protein
VLKAPVPRTGVVGHAGAKARRGGAGAGASERLRITAEASAEADPSRSPGAWNAWHRPSPRTLAQETPRYGHRPALRWHIRWWATTIRGDDRRAPAPRRLRCRGADHANEPDVLVGCASGRQRHLERLRWPSCCGRQRRTHADGTSVRTRPGVPNMRLPLASAEAARVAAWVPLHERVGVLPGPPVQCGDPCVASGQTTNHATPVDAEGRAPRHPVIPGRRVGARVPQPKIRDA